MKKFFLGLLLASFCFSTAFAAPGHRKQRPAPPHHPAPVVVKNHHHHDSWKTFFAGLIGSAIGSYIVTNQYQSTTQPDSHCVVMQSRRNGNIVRKCFTVTNSTNWQSQNVYDILYID